MAAAQSVKKLDTLAWPSLSGKTLKLRKANERVTVTRLFPTKAECELTPVTCKVGVVGKEERPSSQPSPGKTSSELQAFLTEHVSPTHLRVSCCLSPSKGAQGGCSSRASTTWTSSVPI